MKTLRISLILCTLISVYSCVSPEKLVNFQEARPVDSTKFVSTTDSQYVATIQRNDALGIFVSSSSKDASHYFNFSERPEDQSSSANVYLVNNEGNVRIPMVGDIQVVGMTSSQARDTITRRLEKFLVNPTVKVTIRNFRVTVIGEVNDPGVITVTNEQITLPEALAMAGDFTVYSRRDNVMIIRDQNGKKTYHNVDLNSRELFNTPYYYLHSNDIVYVEPLKTKRAMAENWYRVIPLVFSGISLVLAVWATVN